MKNDPHSCECDLCKPEKVLKFFRLLMQLHKLC